MNCFLKSKVFNNIPIDILLIMWSGFRRGYNTTYTCVLFPIISCLLSNTCRFKPLTIGHWRGSYIDSWGVTNSWGEFISLIVSRLNRLNRVFDSHRLFPKDQDIIVFRNLNEQSHSNNNCIWSDQLSYYFHFVIV